MSLLLSTLAVALAWAIAGCTDATGETSGGEPLPPVAIPSPSPSDAGRDAADGGDADAGDARDDTQAALPFSAEESAFAFVPRELQKNGVTTGAKND